VVLGGGGRAEAAKTKLQNIQAEPDIIETEGEIYLSRVE